jgi:hypothetical protein
MTGSVEIANLLQVKAESKDCRGPHPISGADVRDN